jgi:hypothetical protein
VIRLLLWIALAVGLVFCGSTVKLGSRTFFGHVRAIWATDEAKDMRDGISDKAGPMVDKVKRGAKAGWDEATKDGGSGSGSGSGSAQPERAPPAPR